MTEYRLPPLPVAVSAPGSRIRAAGVRATELARWGGSYAGARSRWCRSKTCSMASHIVLMEALRWECSSSAAAWLSCKSKWHSYQTCSASEASLCNLVALAILRSNDKSDKERLASYC